MKLLTMLTLSARLFSTGLFMGGFESGVGRSDGGAPPIGGFVFEGGRGGGFVSDEGLGGGAPPTEPGLIGERNFGLLKSPLVLGAPLPNTE